MGAKVNVVAPKTLIPKGLAEQYKVTVIDDLKEAVKISDVVMMLRMQMERMDGFFFPNAREYSMFFGLDGEVMKHAKPNAIVMHPGPVNRGLEIMPDIADGPKSVILDQVENGVAVRMALLYLLCGESKSS